MRFTIRSPREFHSLWDKIVLRQWRLLSNQGVVSLWIRPVLTKLRISSNRNSTFVFIGVLLFTFLQTLTQNAPMKSQQLDYITPYVLPLYALIFSTSSILLLENKQRFMKETCEKWQQ